MTADAQRIALAIYMAFTLWSWVFVATFPSEWSFVPAMMLTGVTLERSWDFRQTPADGTAGVDA